jgi:hypothetical protein
MRRLLASLAIIAGLWCAAAQAAVTNIGDTATFNSATSVVTAATTVPAGALIVVPVYNGGSSGPASDTVTDSQGNCSGYHQITTQVISTSTWIEIFYCVTTHALTGGTDTITFTASDGAQATYISLSPVYTTGYATLDTATTTSSNAYATTWTVTGNGSAAVANELYFGVAYANGGTIAVTGSGTWSTAPPNTPSALSGSFISSYQTNSGTSALTYSGTSASQYVSAIIVSFEPTGGAAVRHNLSTTGAGN